MSWNIGLMFIKAKESDIPNIIPDVFEKVASNVIFEDITSCTMDNDLGVCCNQEWVIIVDVMGRIITNDRFVKQVAKKYEVKTIYISNDLIYRQYRYGLFRKGSVQKQIKGAENGYRYLKNKGIEETMDGEIIGWRIVECDIFHNTGEENSMSMMDLLFDRYTLD